MVGALAVYNCALWQAQRVHHHEHTRLLCLRQVGARARHVDLTLFEFDHIIHYSHAYSYLRMGNHAFGEAAARPTRRRFREKWTFEWTIEPRVMLAGSRTFVEPNVHACNRKKAAVQQRTTNYCTDALSDASAFGVGTPADSPIATTTLRVVPVRVRGSPLCARAAVPRSAAGGGC